MRTDLGQSIGLTAGVTFDLSKNDPRTAFDPSDIYPDIEFLAGLLLGTVLTRQRYEKSRRRDEMAWEMEGRAERAQAAAVERAALADREERATPVERIEPVVAADRVSATLTPPPALASTAPLSPAPIRQPAPPASPEELRALEERLSRLEMQMRLAQIEARLRELANRLRDYLVIAGAPQGSVVALGMGSAESVVGWETEDAQRANTRLEIERLR